MRIRLGVLLALTALCLLALPAAHAWANGPDGNNSFGTHDWILQEANRLAASRGAGWLILKVALPHTDDPDSVFHDFCYHVYERWNGHDVGTSPCRNPPAPCPRPSAGSECRCAVVADLQVRRTAGGPLLRAPLLRACVRRAQRAMPWTAASS